RRFAAGIEKWRTAIQLKQADFGLRFADGPLADLEFLDPLTVGCRLEEIAAADALADGRPQDALSQVENLLRAARLLTHVWNITTRIAAANLRADALEVMRTIANHPEVTREA